MSINTAVNGGRGAVGVANRAVFVTAGATGQLVTIPRLLGSGSTISLRAGGAGNLTLAGGNKLSLASGISDGQSQDALVQEDAGSGNDARQVKYRLRVTGRSTGGTPTPTPTPTPATSTIAMTQVPEINSYRTYQRDTKLGGASNAGAGVIPVSVNASVAGTVHARLRDAVDGTTIIVPEFVVANLPATGSQTINVPVDARKAWFFIDLRDSSGWKNGTTPVGMGIVVGMAGQSLISGFLTATAGAIAAENYTPSPFISALISSDNYAPDLAAAPWQLVQDRAPSAGVNSVGVAEFLTLKANLANCNVSLAARGQGSQNIASFVNGDNKTLISAALARSDNRFEEFHWGQGHSDTINTRGGYKTCLSALFAGFSADNPIDYDIFLWSVPNIANGLWGSPWQINQIRKADYEWAAENGAYVVHPYDLELNDGVHQSAQLGNRRLGQHMYRASRVLYGLAGDDGAEFVSAVRTAAQKIRVTLTDKGQTNWTKAGSPQNLVFVYPEGYVAPAQSQDNRFQVTSVDIINGTTWDLNLANDPGAGAVLHLYGGWPNGVSTNGATDRFLDNRTDDGDGLAFGRLLKPNVKPIVVAAITPGSTVNAPPGGYKTYDGDEALKSGTAMTIVDGTAGLGRMLTEGKPLSDLYTMSNPPFTVDVLFRTPDALPSGRQAIAAIFNYLALSNDSGQIEAGFRWSDNGVVAAASDYIASYSFGPSGVQVWLKNLTTNGPVARVVNDPTPYVAVSGGAGRNGIRSWLGYDLVGGGVYAVRASDIERYAGATPVLPVNAAQLVIDEWTVRRWMIEEANGATVLREDARW